MDLIVPSFSVQSGVEEILRFPGDCLSDGENVLVSGCDWDRSRLLALGAFRITDVSSFTRDYKIRSDEPRQSLDNVKCAYVSPTPEAEVSHYWPTVEAEIKIGCESSSWPSHTESLLAALRLKPLLHRIPSSLSGGETAKMILVCHLVSHPKVLILDHILSTLDVQSRRVLLSRDGDFFNDTHVVVVDESRFEEIGIRWDVSSRDVAVTRTVVSGVVHSPLHTFQSLQILPCARLSAKNRGALVIRDLTITRGEGILISDFSLSAQSGEFYWVLGPNGSGKTSFFDVLVGWLEPSKGQIEWTEESVVNSLQTHIAYSPQEPECDVTELTLWDELTIALSQKHGNNNPLADDPRQLLQRLQVPVSIWRAPLQNDLSMKKITSVLANLSRGRNVCLLDEPTLYLGQKYVGIAAHAIQLFLQSGGIVFCSTHSPDFYTLMVQNLETTVSSV